MGPAVIIPHEKSMLESPDRPGDEPTLSGEKWVEYGGELIWAIDFTAGGAPTGLTSKEFRRLNAELEHRAGWARAKALLAWAFEACSSPVAEIEVGRVKKVGEGLFRKVYAAHVDLSPDPENLSGVWAVLLPDRRATTADCRRWVREVTILGQLARERLPFRVPAPLGAFPDGDRPAIIRRFADGIPVDLRAGRMPSIRPAQLVGQIAAAIHAIDVTAWRRRPPGAAMRRAHADELGVLPYGRSRVRLGDRHARRAPPVPDGSRPRSPSRGLCRGRWRPDRAFRGALLRALPRRAVVSGSAARTRSRAARTGAGQAEGDSASCRRIESVGQHMVTLCNELSDE